SASTTQIGTAGGQVPGSTRFSRSTLRHLHVRKTWMDRISVVMPAYNASATLEASMRSALAQTHGEVELLVIDDCSTDGSWDLLQALAATDARVVPIRQPRNAGVAAARNAGIEAATGRYIAFLDSDDRWY